MTEELQYQMENKAQRKKLFVCGHTPMSVVELRSDQVNDIHCDVLSAMSIFGHVSSGTNTQEFFLLSIVKYLTVELLGI